jgi:hypothetical protein
MHVRIPVATPAISTVDSRVLPQAFHTNDVKVPQSGHDSIHPDPFEFINYYVILSYIVDTDGIENNAHKKRLFQKGITIGTIQILFLDNI